MADAVGHPTPQELSAFGLGKLPEPTGASVAAHLAACPQCQETVAGLPPDTFLGKVRAARPTGSSAPPGKRPSGASHTSSAGKRPTKSAAPSAGLPPELAQHSKFRIVIELGRGGTGVVDLAEHRIMEKQVALKVIWAAVLDNPDALARFHAEARAAGKLHHPNIARAYDADQADPLRFLVLEYDEGISLAQWLEQNGRLSIQRACHFARQAALGLHHAYEPEVSEAGSSTAVARKPTMESRAVSLESPRSIARGRRRGSKAKMARKRPWLDGALIVANSLLVVWPALTFRPRCPPSWR